MLELYTFHFSAMGTACVLHLYATDKAIADAIAQSAIAEVHRIERRYSRYTVDSFLSRINRVAEHAGTIDVDSETAGLLDYAYSCYAKSDGLFDISSGVLRKAWDFSRDQLPAQSAIESFLPLVGLDKVIWKAPSLTFSMPGMELDFGGIGKEYAVDRAAAICISLGIEHGLVDLGGDIHIIGPHPNHEPWIINIRHPRNLDSFMATVHAEQDAIASSGDYERFIDVEGRRYCHIINPHTGWPVRGLSSVTVQADKCLVAGSLSSIAMLKGAEGISWLRDMCIPHLYMDEFGALGGTHPFQRLTNSKI